VLTITYVRPTILQTPSIRCQQERARHRRGGYRQSKCREHGPFDEERAYRRAGKHRDDGTKPSLPAGIATPRQGRVRGKTRNGQRQHGSGEISDSELSDGCISHAHGQREYECGQPSELWLINSVTTNFRVIWVWSHQELTCIKNAMLVSIETEYF
jgi:hypothetical protein